MSVPCQSNSKTEGGPSDLTDFGTLYAIATWFTEVGPLFRQWLDSHPEQEASLGWLADGIDIAAEHLTGLADHQIEADPLIEIRRGERPRH